MKRARRLMFRRPPGSVLAWLAAAAISWALPAEAEIIDEVAARYRAESGIKGRFEQVLMTGHGERTRVYRGHYRYTSGRGLTWEVTSPVKGRIAVNKDGDAEISGELGGLSIFEKRTVGRLVVAMVSLDTSVLGRYYTIDQTAHESGFRITLNARERWKKQAGTVAILGTRLVNEVRMQLPDGRAMNLSLTHE